MTTAARFAGLLSAVLLAGCASSPPPSSYKTVQEDLPLILNRTDRVIELLDGVLVGSEIVAVGDGGTILRSQDYGHTWEKSVVPVQSTLTGVSFASDAQHGWAVGHDAVILATADGGLTWQAQWQGENHAEWFLDVCAVNERRVIAVGMDGLYVESSDGGTTWTRRRVLDWQSHLNRISRGPTGTLYLAGEHGSALRSSDQGLTWITLALPTEKTLYGILPLGSGALLAYGGSMSGKIFRSEDDGRTWFAMSLARNILLKTGLILHDGSILLAGNHDTWHGNHGFFISHDGGHTFEPWKNTTPEVTLFELLQAPDGSILAFGTEGATILNAR